MEIVTNPILLFIIAVASLIVGLIPYLLGLRKKRFIYCSNSFELIRDSSSTISGLSVTFRENEINQLTISRVAIWYGGRGSINSNDLAKIKPLSIAGKNDSEILEASIIDVSDKDSMVSIAKKDSEIIEFTFDYFDYRAGFVVEVIHTGEANDLDLIGKIQGGNAPKKIGRTEKISRKLGKRMLKICMGAMVLIASFVSIVTITLGFSLALGQTSFFVPQSQAHLAIPLFIFMVVYCAIIDLLTYFVLSREYRLDVPSYFRKKLDLE